MPRAPPASSACRQTAWWSWARRSSSKEGLQPPAPQRRGEVAFLDWNGERCVAGVGEGGAFGWEAVRAVDDDRVDRLVAGQVEIDCCFGGADADAVPALCQSAAPACDRRRDDFVDAHGSE